MGGEWKRLLGRSALYILLVLAFPALLVTAMLIKGKGFSEGLWELSMYLFTQGWGMVSLLLAVQLGSTTWRGEDRGAWEYLASLPHEGLYLLRRKLMPRLIILLGWCLGFALLQLLPFTEPQVISEAGLPSMIIHPAQVLVFSLFWFIPSSLLTIIRETDNLKRQLFGWFGLTSLYLWAWGLATLQKTGSFELFRLEKQAMLDLLGTAGIGSLSLYLLIGLLPLLWISHRAVCPLTMNTPERFLAGFQRWGLPIYALPWIWFIGALLTGGIK